MQYTLRINGVEFPNQHHSADVGAHAVAEEFAQKVKTGGHDYIGTGNEQIFVNWGRVTTVQVIVADTQPDV